MAKKNYDLKTDAIERLVNAEKKDYSGAAKNPGKEYRSKGFLSHIPDWGKALFVKFWFSGAVCYFILWGLGLYVSDSLDMMVVLAVVLGMVTDILVNNAFRFFEIEKGQNSKWMMFPQKKFWTFFANIVYAFVLLICVIWFYNVINGLSGVLIGVEPILFGIAYTLFDMCFISAKNTMISVIADAKRKNGV